MVDRITRRSQQIADFPLSGHTVPEYNIDQIREIIEGPYRIIYHIKPNQIDVLAVIHGEEMPSVHENEGLTLIKSAFFPDDFEDHVLIESRCSTIITRNWNIPGLEI